MEWLMLLVGFVVGLFIAYIWFQSRIDFEVQKYLQLNIDKIRQETLDRSRAVLKGKIGEQMAPLLSEFHYKPSDARFIGSPIDYVIFDGYTESKDEGGESEIRVVFMDVKKGEKATLTKIQRRIRDAIEKKNVVWETLKLQD